uniref:Uncharacterized protein n=1 Tax=Aegilops tauschii subsp. strangulata TaxID=200361 RepID=A0A453L4S2_AEGTS
CILDPEKLEDLPPSILLKPVLIYLFLLDCGLCLLPPAHDRGHDWLHDFCIVVLGDLYV